MWSHYGVLEPHLPSKTNFSNTFSKLCQDTHLLLTGGLEKVLRIYDLNRPDAPPREVDKSPGSIRTVTWLHSDQTILSSCTDMGGVRYALLGVNLLSQTG